MSDTDKKPWEGETPPAAPDENKPEPTDENAAPAVPVETPAPKPEPVKVAKGDQAPLALINLVSQGISMKKAKKQLGIK